MATKTCGKCGGDLESGFTTAVGLVGTATFESEKPRLAFVVPGTPTSLNPLRAFEQGLAREPEDRRYRIAGFRCTNCGALELYAEENAKPT